MALNQQQPGLASIPGKGEELCQGNSTHPCPPPRAEKGEKNPKCGTGSHLTPVSLRRGKPSRGWITDFPWDGADLAQDPAVAFPRINAQDAQVEPRSRQHLLPRTRGARGLQGKAGDGDAAWCDSTFRCCQVPASTPAQGSEHLDRHHGATRTLQDLPKSSTPTV